MTSRLTLQPCFTDVVPCLVCLCCMCVSKDGPTLWHTDLATSPLDSNDMVTVWIPLTYVPAKDQGGSSLSFATASHRDMSVHYWWDPHDDDDDVIAERYKVEDYGALNPGKP